MTLEQTKEQLSIHYLGAIVSRAGHRLEFPGLPANGVDVMITEISRISYLGKVRFSDIGNTIDIQVKCTTEKKIFKGLSPQGKPVVKYDLKTKNFNDLVLRQKTGQNKRVKPLVLILFVLPDDQKKWARLWIDDDAADKFLQLGGIAYWFRPEGAH